MSMIKCPECRQKISENAVSCPKCGHQITDEDREKAKEQEEKSRKSAKKAGIWFSCSVGIIFVIIVALIIFSPKPEKVPTEQIAEEIDAILSLTFDQYDLTTDGDEINVSMTIDGLAEAVLIAKIQGEGVIYDQWQDLKKNTQDCAKSIQEYIEVHDRDDIKFTLTIVNDKNPNNILLSYYKGMLIFDIVEE